MLLDATTLSDLEIFQDSQRRGGLLALIDETQTRMGHEALKRRMRAPLTQPEAIREVQRAVRFFADHPRAFRLRSGNVEALKRYTESNIVLQRRGSTVRALWFRLRYRDLFAEIRSGVLLAHATLVELAEAARDVLALAPPELVRNEVEALLEACERCRPGTHSEWPPSVLRVDRGLRGGLRADLEALVAQVGEIDALRSMGLATRRLGWSLPEILDADDFHLEAEDLRHPFVDGAVGNPIGLSGGEPLVFLTGPNMAGKTTYLRAAALVLVLGQVGMGVPATSARLTPVEVLLTSLNPADNLRAGLSFFFSEVLRVKEAAEHLARGRRCFVLFDEVFKGTNVRDALEASTAVILGFAKAHRSGFVFSSHLTELVDALEAEPRIRFYHFDGRVVDGRAQYSYRVRPGVSDERLGLHLLEQADIPELIARIAAA